MFSAVAETVLRIDAGKLFHVRGQVIGNERSPTVTNRDRGTERIPVLHFRIRIQKLPEAPPSDEIAMTSFPANIKS